MAKFYRGHDQLKFLLLPDERTMLGKILVFTPTTLFAAVAVKQNAGDSKKSPPEDELAHYKCRPSDLPVYTPLHAYKRPKGEAHPPKNSAPREALESGVRAVRSEVQSGISVLGEQKKWLNDIIDTGVAHTQSTLDYIKEPQNVMARSGAIALGGLTGLIFAARGGFVKKVLYTTAGAGVVASVCYPQQAEEYARDALFETRKGFAIAYNFVKGVKPGDETPVEPINKFPTSLEDLKHLFWDLWDEAKDAIFSKKK